MNHVALEQPFFMRSCQTYWRKPPQGKICHNSLICWKTIRNYVKCTRRDSGVCHKGVERIPVRSHCEGSRFQQLTRRELSAGKKRLILIIWNLPAPRFQPPFFFLLGCWQRSRGGSADEHCPNEGCKSTGSNWTGLWDYWTDYRTIIGQKVAAAL